ncbi:MAG: DUF3102 domain-containing protein [Clostridia bacterium]|nr:DUF3102 domain-containing protein [Clostridia bacterium]
MNEIANTTQTSDPAALDNLATQAQMFSYGAAMNLLQLGRVLTEAKPLVPHGEWTEWIKINAHMPLRRAQEYMQAYRKFGLDQRIAQLGASQIIALLPMSDEEREELLAENDVASMTTREIENAIEEQRERLRAEAMAEAQAAIEQEKRARYAAEKRAEMLEARDTEIPQDLVDQINNGKAEIARLSEMAKETLADAQRLRREKTVLERSMQEQEALLQEQQEEINRAQEELLNLKSAQARGEAARTSDDTLTPDAFSAAVREFMGLCARMPYMGAAFSAMPQSEKAIYAELLHTIEGWTVGARQALECITVEGGVLIGE